MKILHQNAEKIICLAEDDLEMAIEQLVEFSKTYATDSRLRTQSVLLNFELKQIRKSSENIHGSEQETQRLAKIKLEISELVDKIVTDCKTNPERNEIQSIKKKVREHFIEQRPKHDIVFKGDGITKSYKRRGTKTFTLEPINLTLKQGEITGVVGENGFGKTTLLKIVAGQLAHDDGQLSYPLLNNGKHNWMKIKQQIGYIPQQLIKWNGTVRQNLCFSSVIKGIKGKQSLDETDFILRRLNLTDYENMRYNDLSGGYKTRFELAKCLVWKPKLLVLDEPLAPLDVKAQSVFLRDLRQLTDSIRYPLSVIISSQHLHEIEKVSDNIVFLKQGRARYNGPMKDFGGDRNENHFELGCDINDSLLNNILKDIKTHRIYNDGSVYMLQTPLEVSGSMILNKLLQNDIKIQYFRDISESTRKLFETQG